jgi:hypothetical protein
MRACFCSVLTLGLLLISVPATGVVLQSVSLSQSSVTGGTKVAGTVTLDVPALGGGVVVRLSSSDPAASVEPAQITVPAGTTTASFSVSTIPIEDRQIRLVARPGVGEKSNIMSGANFDHRLARVWIRIAQDHFAHRAGADALRFRSDFARDWEQRDQPVW